MDEKLGTAQRFSQFLNGFAAVRTANPCGSHFDKIVKLLTNLKEEKLKMIYEVIKIIVGVPPGKSDISSLISSEASGFMTNSDKISPLFKEGSYKKESSLRSNKPEASRLLLKKKRSNSEIQGKKQKISKFAGKKKIISNNPPKIFQKVYEMSDKTSLNSFEEATFDQTERNFSNNKVRIIDPRNLGFEKNNILKNLYNLNNDYTSSQKLNRNFTSKAQYNQTSFNSLNKCPKVLLDYDQSSNSDLEHLLVTSGQEKLNLRDKIILNNSQQNTPNTHKDKNILFSNKPKQVFFPCEVPKLDSRQNSKSLFTSGQKTTPFNSGTPRTSQYDFFPNPNLFTNSSIFKQPISPGLEVFSIPGPISLNISLFNTNNTNNK